VLAKHQSRQKLLLTHVLIHWSDSNASYEGSEKCNSKEFTGNVC